MQAPGFWQHEKGGILAQLLTPLGWIYGFATKLKLAGTTPWVCPVPVLCVGNLVAGGAGKTPMALDLGERLLARGRCVHFLSRGYGGYEKGPLLVDPDVHDHSQVGDEPLLLAALAPTWVSRSRKSGCLAAAAAGADLIVMDDGFQNPYIGKTFSIIVVDGGYGFGNARMIPAGPLRERVVDGLARAEACVVIGEDRCGAMKVVSGCGLAPLTAKFVASPLAGDIAAGPVIAFAGIGRPEKFFETVSQLGCKVVSTIPFADHHPYSDADIEHLIKIAAKENARLITTQKDARRLPPSFMDDVGVVSVTLEWSDEAALEALLDKICNA
jgi:tetraacyldisaccharide 4'-kinase